MKKSLPIIFILLIIACLIIIPRLTKKTNSTVTNFKECAEQNNLVMESYPRMCRFNGKIFTENIGNELEKRDLIHITTPRPNDVIKSPLVIEGEARGMWFFEASFPITLLNAEGTTIAEWYATAQGEWMTEEFVPFKATLVFKNEEALKNLEGKNEGTLMLKKDNPSGLPEHDDALIIPVSFDNQIK